MKMLDHFVISNLLDSSAFNHVLNCVLKCEFLSLFFSPRVNNSSVSMFFGFLK